MKNKVERSVRFLKSINEEGKNIPIGKRLYRHISNLEGFISKEALYRDKLGEISMGFDYFFGISSGDGRWTMTMDAIEALEDILYGVYLTTWYRDHDEGEPANIDEFLEVDYCFLEKMI